MSLYTDLFCRVWSGVLFLVLLWEDPTAPLLCLLISIAVTVVIAVPHHYLRGRKRHDAPAG